MWDILLICSSDGIRTDDPNNLQWIGFSYTQCAPLSFNQGKHMLVCDARLIEFIGSIAWGFPLSHPEVSVHTYLLPRLSLIHSWYSVDGWVYVIALLCSTLLLSGSTRWEYKAWLLIFTANISITSWEYLLSCIVYVCYLCAALICVNTFTMLTLITYWTLH